MTKRGSNKIERDGGGGEVCVRERERGKKRRKRRRKMEKVNDMGEGDIITV